MELLIVFAILVGAVLVLYQVTKRRPCDKPVHYGEPVVLKEQSGYEILYYPDTETFEIYTKEADIEAYETYILPTYYSFIELYMNEGHDYMMKWHSTGLTQYFNQYSFPELPYVQLLNEAINKCHQAEVERIKTTLQLLQ